MPNPDLIYLYTYGRLAAYRDLESGSLVLKDTETGKTHESSMIEADPEEGMVAFLAEILESQPTANPTTAFGVPPPGE
jgi:hypothetical protein